MPNNTTRRWTCSGTRIDFYLVDLSIFQNANTKELSVKRPSIYLKMKVLGAIDIAPGKTRDERVRNVAVTRITV